MLVRDASRADVSFLREMLFEAFFWDLAAPRPGLSEFLESAEAVKLIGGWGRPGDYAVIAEEDGTRVGAAWYRRWSDADHSYGFVAADVPELGIAVQPAFRSRGVGRALLAALIAQAVRAEFRGLSLSVNPGNRARALYESFGFRRSGESGTSWTYLLPLRDGGDADSHATIRRR
jgi:ribosomal protein S18 acetylase RimI-like enzyme